MTLQPFFDSCSATVHRSTMERLIRVESAGNPLAIGVVGDHLVRQPRSVEEALATVKSLEAAGRNYSVGLGQINRIHFKSLGWDASLAAAFDPCVNLHAAASVLTSCYLRAEKAGFASGDSALGAALSCYYSDDFYTGRTAGYVQAVLGASRGLR